MNDVWARVRALRPRPLALSIRAVPVVATAVALLAAGRLIPFWTTVTVILVAGATVYPQRSVSGFAVSAVFIDWLISYSWNAHPPVARTVIFAAALYVLHSTLAIGAVIPAAARVEAAVVHRWLMRTTTVSAVSAAFIATQYTLGTGRASPALEATGLLGSAGVVAAFVVIARRATHGQARDDHAADESAVPRR